MDPYFAAASAFQILSGAQQAEIVRGNAELSRMIGEMNAQQAEIDAYNSEQDGLSEVARYQTAIDQVEGQQRVVNAANDVDSNFGTAAELIKESKLTGYLNKLDIINKAHEEAMGYKRQAANYRLGGQQAEAQGAYNATAIRNSSIMSGISTYLTGYERYNDRTKSTRRSAMTTAQNVAD